MHLPPQDCLGTDCNSVWQRLTSYIFRLGDLHLSCEIVCLTYIWRPCLSGACYNENLSKFGFSSLRARKKLRKQTLASIQPTMVWFHKHRFIQTPNAPANFHTFLLGANFGLWRYSTKSVCVQWALRCNIGQQRKIRGCSLTHYLGFIAC